MRDIKRIREIHRIIHIMNQVSLNYEASAGDTHKQVVTSLPPEVVQCLDNARFVRSISILYYLSRFIV